MIGLADLPKLLVFCREHSVSRIQLDAHHCEVAFFPPSPVPVVQPRREAGKTPLVNLNGQEMDPEDLLYASAEGPP